MAAGASDLDREHSTARVADAESAPAVEPAAASGEVKDEAKPAPTEAGEKTHGDDGVEAPVEPVGRTLATEAATADAAKTDAPKAGARETDRAAPAPAIALPRAEPASPLGEALAALDRRDYATARRLFEALGRTDAAQAIDTALAALDRKDYTTAQGLFEALKPSLPAAPASGARAWDARGRDDPKLVRSPPAVIPTVAPVDRAPSPLAEKKRRGSRGLWLAACLALLGIAGAAALYGSQGDGAFVAMKNRAIATVTSAADRLKSPPQAATPAASRSDQAAATGDHGAQPTPTPERPATADSGAMLTQATTDRLDRLEHETAARFDALGARSDPSVSAKLADLAARLDALEKKSASPAASSATPSVDSADLAARLDRLEKQVAATPATQISDLTTRLDRLEKRAAALAAPPVPAATLASAATGAPDAVGQKIPPSPPPKPSTLVARTQPSAANANARPEAPRRLLQDYSVETVQGGMAVVASRYGAQQVQPGDFIPGAGRVLRIERHNGDWYVLTSGGVIAGGPPEYDAPY